MYEPATSAVIPVGIGVGIPNFVPHAPFSVVAGDSVTVSWNLFNASATGTVTVWGDGTLWCNAVPLTDLSCTGQFLPASATGSPVEIIVRYSGDSNWGGIEPHLSALVGRCVVPDVTSAQPSLGTVQIDTVSNCGVGGYLTGTTVFATATPISPNVFVDWKKLGGAGLIVDTTLSTVGFTVTTDSTTWVRVATFSLNCYPVTGAVTGHGGISVYPASNCTTLGGAAGYAPGTAITVYPDATYNSYYEEPDAFYSFGAVAGGTVGKDSTGQSILNATVTEALTIPVTFGPLCRTVTVKFAPATDGDSSTAPTPTNCASPQATGFTRFTPVTVKAVSGDPTLAISGWLLNGVAQPSWGTTSEQKVTIGAVTPVLTVQLVHCYTLDLKIDGVQDARNRDMGAVKVDVEPNCPDGSRRYMSGTKVTVTPQILIEGGAFNGWDTARIQPKSPGGIGDLTSEARTVTMTADLTLTAGFYFKDTCSALQIIDNVNILTFDDDGCGPGQYFDLQKQSALRNGDDPASYWQARYRTQLTAHVNPNIPLAVYASVRGDVGTCFGAGAASGPTTDLESWKTYGPLKGDISCAVGGAIQMQVATCQRFTTEVGFLADGDTSGTIYPASTVPSNLLVPGPDGLVGSIDLGTFNWMLSVPIQVTGGSVKAANYGDDPCTRGGINMYPAGRNLALYAFGPVSGFKFSGWDYLDPTGLVDENPTVAPTTDTSATVTAYPVYTVTCHTLSLGEGISVIGDAPYCPGLARGANSFIEGAAVQVKAAQHVGERPLYGFKKGVVGAQITKNPTTQELTSFVVMDSDKSVTADYPTKTEEVSRAIVQGLKISVGILAVVAPIALGMIFPPAGIFFAFLSAGAGIASLIKPGGAEVAAVLDLINPSKIATCAARWGFSNSGNPTGGLGVGGMMSTANTFRKLYQGVDVVFEKVGPLGVLGGAASLGYGLYDAGIGHAELGTQSVEQLRGTSTMTGCLDQQWRIAGSNITGH